MAKMMYWVRRLYLGVEYRGRLQLDELDGIRGLAVLFVLMSHLANAGLNPVPICGDGAGKIGVYLFFTLSSFLLSRALFEAGDAGRLNTKYFLNYFYRRVMRVYPFYIVVLFFTVLASSLHFCVFPDMKFSDVFRHIFLLDGRLHLWTIATEMKFYFFLPLLVGLYFWCFNGKLLSFSICVITLSIASSLLSMAVGVKTDSNLSLMRYISVFSMGIIIARIYATYGTNISIRHWRRVNATASYILLLLLFLLMPNVITPISNALIGRTLPLRHPIIFIFWGGLCSLFVYSCIQSKGTLLNRLFSSTVLRIVGAMSFSLYINHWFVLEFVTHKLPHSVLGISYFWVLTIFISSITYLAIERPIARINIWRNLSIK